MRLHYQQRIPIIGSKILRNSKRIQPKSPLAHVFNGTYTPSDFRRFVTSWDKYTRPMSVLKPARRLGGAWFGDFVAQRRAVSLCLDCERKYGDWHIKANYSKRDARAITDCDGCGESPVICSSYYSALSEKPLQGETA